MALRLHTSRADNYRRQGTAPSYKKYRPTLCSGVIEFLLSLLIPRHFTTRRDRPAGNCPRRQGTKTACGVTAPNHRTYLPYSPSARLCRNVMYHVFVASYHQLKAYAVFAFKLSASVQACDRLKSQGKGQSGIYPCRRRTSWRMSYRCNESAT